MGVLSFADVSRDQLANVADAVAKELSKEAWFNVALIGEMGAGKTTFSGFLLHALGVPASQPVTSPTFTYLNEYRTGAGRLLAHLDMYRAESDMSLEDLGASDVRGFWGILVEWPERLLEPAPTHRIEIEFQDDPSLRRISLQRLS